MLPISWLTAILFGPAKSMASPSPKYCLMNNGTFEQDLIFYTFNFFINKVLSINK